MPFRPRFAPVQLVVGCLVLGLAVAAAVSAGTGPQPIRAAGPAAPRAVAQPVAAGPAPGAPGAAAPTGAGTLGAPTAATGPVDPVSATVAPPVQHAATRWVADTAAATGIPARALQAYAEATLAVRASDPGCGLGWTTLAAIGAIESGHGTHGGTSLGADGRPLVPILGPALDGRPGFAAIAASAESAAWTGDPRWDHAVGPMQFLTSTWLRWRADGDGDGASDPNDLDDAALAAGHYLCAAGRDLRSPAGWTAAVLAYNHDGGYLRAVLQRANGYAAAAG